MALFESALNYKLAWDKALKYYACAGRIAPKPPVHPDDVHISYRQGVVRFALTQKERDLFALVRECRQPLMEEERALREELKAETDHDARKEIEIDLKTTRHALDLIEQILPE